MNAFINKTNQYLIERYPNLWNTRLVWMLLTAIGLHILFFIAGFFAIQIPTVLHESSMSDEYFMSRYGTIPFSIVISIAVLVLWIVMLVKNNAFKNYYPHSQNKLFLSFFYFLLIFLTNTTYYLSFGLGYKVYLNNAYSTETIKEYIENGNTASVFFNFSMADYDLKNKKYPSPFDSVFIETNYSNIAEQYPYIKTKRSYYQFYKIRQEICTDTSDFISCVDKYQGKAVGSEMITDKTYVYYLKDTVLDLSAIVDTHLTYYNFSSPFFWDYYNRYESGFDYQYNSYGIIDSVSKQYLQDYNKKIHTLLALNSQTSIEQILEVFLQICEKLNIKTNLTTKDWLRIVYKPETYRVDSFIKNGSTSKYWGDDYKEEYPSYEDTMAVSTATVDIVTPNDDLQNKIDAKYFHNHLTHYFLDADALKNNLYNIQNLKHYSFLDSLWKFHIWFAFGLAAMLFMYRITDLKAVIFTGVGTAIISILVALVLLVVNMGLYYNSGDSTFFNFYFVVVVMAIVLLTPLLFSKTTNKLVKAIFINITLVLPVVFVLLLLVIVDEHMHKACLRVEDCNYDSIFRTNFEIIYWGLLIFALFFNYCYIKYIIRWKGLPAS